jgi:hypothetical protein
VGVCQTERYLTCAAWHVSCAAKAGAGMDSVLVDAGTNAVGGHGAQFDFVQFLTRPIQCWKPPSQDPSGLAEFVDRASFLGDRRGSRSLGCRGNRYPISIRIEQRNRHE